LKTIVLFTASYPYSIALENTFLEEEIFYLSKHFHVIIIPQKRKGKKSEFASSLNNIEIWNDLPQFRKKDLFQLFSITFLKEILHIHSIIHLKQLIIHYLKAETVKSYLIKKFETNKLKKDFIYYTFWFDSSTTALSLLKEKYNLKFFTRVHGGDLYLERNHGYIPFRAYSIEKTDKIVAVSQKAYDYLQETYNLKEFKIDLFHLLSKDYGIINPVNNEKFFRIVSCALVSPLKRVDEIIRLLALFSQKFNIRVDYMHIGNGEDFAKISNMAKTYETDFFNIHLTGFKDIEEIMDIYKKKPFDFFVTLSETEGGVPFALREAASCEIPLIGTNVGGIPEIIEDGYNGFMVTKNFSDDEVLDVLRKAYRIKCSKNNIVFRQKSRRIFLNRFEASKNYQKFIKFLERL
jgi:glycosyltransferase involved in cell wall biosynthesis